MRPRRSPLAHRLRQLAGMIAGLIVAFSISRTVSANNTVAYAPGLMTFNARAGQNLGLRSMPGEFTAEFWVTVNVSNRWQHVVEVGCKERARKCAFSIRVGTQGETSFSIGNGKGSVEKTVNAGWKNGERHFVALTYDGKRAKLYQDGNLLANLKVRKDIRNAGGTLMVGSHQGTSAFFNGKVENLAIHKGARTREQILAGMNRLIHRTPGTRVFDAARTIDAGVVEIPRRFTVSLAATIETSRRWRHIVELGCKERKFDCAFRIEAGAEGELFVAVSDGKLTKKRRVKTGWKLGQQIHLALTYDGRDAKLYQDGRYVARIRHGGDLSQGGGSLIVGSRAGKKRFFRGAMRDVQLSRGARTVGQIRAAARFFADTEDLRPYTRFDTCLRTATGEYMSAVPTSGAVVANTKVCGSAESFTLVDVNRGGLHPGDLVFVETARNTYLAAKRTSKSLRDDATIEQRQLFTVVHVGGFDPRALVHMNPFALRSAFGGFVGIGTGKIVSTPRRQVAGGWVEASVRWVRDGDGTVDAAGTAASGGSVLTLMPGGNMLTRGYTACLETRAGKFVSAKHGTEDLLSNADTCGAREKLLVVPTRQRVDHGSTVFLRTDRATYLGATFMGALTDHNKSPDYGTFQIRHVDGKRGVIRQDSQITLRSFMSKYVSDGNGGKLTANASGAGAAESFKIRFVAPTAGGGGGGSGGGSGGSSHIPAPPLRPGKYYKATRHGAWPCARGFYDPRGGGECWKKCPSGYTRTAAPVYAPDACSQWISPSVSNATRHGRPSWGVVCPSGQFFSFIDGGTCWSCSSGTPTHLPVTGTETCASPGGINNASTSFITKAGCPAGTFHDPRNGGECWSCPEGSTRTVAPVDDAKACRVPEKGQSKCRATMQVIKDAVTQPDSGPYAACAGGMLVGMTCAVPGLLENLKPPSGLSATPRCKKFAGGTALLAPNPVLAGMCMAATETVALTEKLLTCLEKIKKVDGHKVTLRPAKLTYGICSALAEPLAFVILKKALEKIFGDLDSVLPPGSTGRKVIAFVAALSSSKVVTAPLAARSAYQAAVTACLEGL